MNKEDIIRMAEEAGAIDYWHLSNLERFATLVASAEREACAKECDACICTAQASEAIRARGQA